MKNKSFAGATAIVVAIVINIFVIAIILTFFYAFKYQISLVILEQYLWNKYQDVPLSLLATDIEGESFVVRANRVYYGFLDAGQFRTDVNEIVKNQVSPTGPAPATVDVKIAGIKFTGEISCDFEIEGCYIEDDNQLFKHVCSCSESCPASGKYLGEVKKTLYLPYLDCEDYYDVCDCLLDVRVVYSAKFPFPITFNGTDKFVDELSYEIVEK